MLEQLQKGVDGQTVADEILSKYLVRTTRQRVQAYRHYREQMGSYWTAEKLEYKHWELLYGQVVAKLKYARDSRPYLKHLTMVRTAFCAELALSEETCIYGAFSHF